MVLKVKGKQLSRLADRAWTRRKLAAGEPGIAPCSAVRRKALGDRPGKDVGTSSRPRPGPQPPLGQQGQL